MEIVTSINRQMRPSKSSNILPYQKSWNYFTWISWDPFKLKVWVVEGIFCVLLRFTWVDFIREKSYTFGTF